MWCSRVKLITNGMEGDGGRKKPNRVGSLTNRECWSLDQFASVKVVVRANLKPNKYGKAMLHACL